MVPACEEKGNGLYLQRQKICKSPIWWVVREDWANCGRAWWCWITWDSEGVSCNTSSCMLGSCYFPRFLVRDGSFTWMYMASFMVLLTPCASQSTKVKHLKSTGCLVVWLCWWIGDGDLRCFLSLSPKFLPDFLMHSSGQSALGHLNWYITQLFDIWCPVWCTWMPKLLQIFMNFCWVLLCKVLP